jgi:hypothetical protein
MEGHGESDDVTVDLRVQVPPGKRSSRKQSERSFLCFAAQVSITSEARWVFLKGALAKF